MKIFLNVPYVDHPMARQLGAKWDIARKKWFVENKPNLWPFLKWMDDALTKPVDPAYQYPPKPSPRVCKGQRKPGKAANIERKRQEKFLQEFVAFLAELRLYDPTDGEKWATKLPIDWVFSRFERESRSFGQGSSVTATKKTLQALIDKGLIICDNDYLFLPPK